jgi:hypothetical protein
MFRNAAAELSDYVNGETFWSRYALITHAIELALKAFVRHSAANGKPTAKEPKQHDLSGSYTLARQYGLQDDPTISQNIDILNELHRFILAVNDSHSLCCLNSLIAPSLVTRRSVGSDAFRTFKKSKPDPTWSDRASAIAGSVRVAQ